MKKLLSILIIVLAIFMFIGCAKQYPPKTIRVSFNDESRTITPAWLQLKNGSCIAWDLDTGMLYAGNEVGEYSLYLSDLPAVDDPSKLDLPKTISLGVGYKAITPVWLQLDNGSVIARDPDTGHLYAGNEVGEYSYYVPDLPDCKQN